MKKLILISIIVLLSLGELLGQKVQINTRNANQDHKLAQQYLQKGEYEKAVAIYEKLYDKNKNHTYYYRQYIKTLVAMGNFEEAESVIKKQMKRKKNDPSLYVDLGNIYKQQDNMDKAQEYFSKAVKDLPTDPNIIRSIASTFNNIDEPDYAIQVYEEGKVILKDPSVYCYDLALAYRKKGDFPNMVSSYLDYALTNPNRVQTVKNAFQRIIDDEENRDEIETQLYQRIQKEPNVLLYPEILTWLYVQQKDYESALIQVRAIDTRMNEDGARVQELALSAVIEEQYDAAIEGFEYVIAKGENGPFFLPAKTELLKVRKTKVTETTDYTQEDILKLEAEYNDFLDRYGIKPSTAASVRELANLYAFYIHNLGKAVVLLEEVVEMNSLNSHLRAYCKLDLGDYYLMQNEVWESTLLYSQVDKAFKEDILGEEARFRNARLSYYRGDFDWAQSQLNVLKASTSELIANDALDLSVFITDNMGLDTTTTPMEMFARSGLLVFQNRIKAATATLDSIDRKFPAHALADDMLMIRAEIKIKEKDFSAAVPFLEDILRRYSTDLLADDAIYKLGELYHFYLDDKEKAMEYYEQLILEHTGSLYTVEARKRFRNLRGDTLN